ncbi:hypothetical protein [Bradyrhizobium sp. B120]|uniref:hypothetical protein n=1 Tax=Bradyrhizobium sp. B120 TaxID=3410088 RepID=UPI003B98164E
MVKDETRAQPPTQPITDFELDLFVNSLAHCLDRAILVPQPEFEKADRESRLDRICRELHRRGVVKFIGSEHRPEWVVADYRAGPPLSPRSRFKLADKVDPYPVNAFDRAVKDAADRHLDSILAATGQLFCSDHMDWRFAEDGSLVWTLRVPGH